MKLANNFIQLSSPSTVSMSDEWYEYSNLDHFWIHHRNVVIDRHFTSLIRKSTLIAEVGCGNGLMLEYIAKSYKKEVEGLELNLKALELCPIVPGNLYVYDILTRHPEMINKYDLILLIDVIEHIENETEFLLAIQDHLKEGGFLLIGVPMRKHLFSAYDVAAGHHRRYSTRTLKSVVQNSGFAVDTIVQWGHIYIPLLMLRKYLLKNRREDSHIRDGFASKGILNSLLGLLRHFDFLPTFNIDGTSCFLLAHKPLP